MHVPDGFIDGRVSAGAGIVAACAIGCSIRKVSATLDESRVPMCGLVASYVFAVQMLNFPIGAGTSGHLLGGVLAAVLVGPWAGALCVSIVLVVQALLFADGGLSALGLNVVNMALAGAFGGYLVFLALRRLLPPRPSAVPVAAGLAAGVAPALAALAFVGEYALGGTATFSVGTTLVAMLGVHALIGVGEGLITGLTVAAVMRTRPDLVHAGTSATLPFAPAELAAA